MKRLIKILIALIVIVTIGLGGLYFALIPSDRLQAHETLKNDSDEFDVVEELSSSLIGNTKFENGVFQGKITINNKFFREIIKEFAVDNANSELLDSSFKLVEDKINIQMPYNLYGVLDSQVDISAGLTNTGNSLKIQVEQIKIGKIVLPEKMVEKIIEDSVTESDFIHKSGPNIYFDGLDYDKIDLQRASIEDSKIILDYSLPIKLDNLLETLKN